MTTKQQLLDLLGKRRRNCEHNRNELAQEAMAAKSRSYSDETFRLAAIRGAQAGEKQYTAEVIDIDEMIALVQRHCPEEP